MNKIYGYFKGNLGDDLMLQQLLLNIGPENCDIVLGGSNYLIEKFECNKIVKFSSVINSNYENFIFVGGSTIQLPSKFFSGMSLFHLKMILTFVILKLRKRKIVYWNTNLYSGKLYDMLLKIYLLFIDEMYVRDQYSATVLERHNFTNYKLICDLVEEIEIEDYSPKMYTGISITETQPRDYIINKLLKIKSELCGDEKLKYIEFQKTDNREFILSVLKQEFPNIEVVLYESQKKSIEAFKDLKYMYCDRFHSIVISQLYNIDSNTDSYNSKATNYLNTPKNEKISNTQLYDKFKPLSKV